MNIDRRRAQRDRRDNPRVSAVFGVIGTPAGTPTPTPRVLLGQAEDIAPEGMTLRWPRDSTPAPEASVALTFALPGLTEPIAAQATVVSCRPAGRYRRTGVRFISLSAEHAAIIESYCAG